MKKSLFQTATSFLSVCLLALSISAQESEKAKIKAKNEKTIVRDKSKPVRRALEKQYARLAKAIRNKDFEAFQGLRTADFSTKGLNGEPQAPQQMAGRARALLDRIQPPIEVGFAIETINFKDKKAEAVATIRQKFSRMQTVAGQLRKVETFVTQDETWVQTPSGEWKLKFVENERNLM